MNNILKIFFVFIFLCTSVISYAEDFCVYENATYSVVWPKKNLDNGTFQVPTTFQDLYNSLQHNIYNQNYTLNFSDTEYLKEFHSIYIPYGTNIIKFAEARHQTTVCTYFFKINSPPSRNDVDSSTLPENFPGFCPEYCPFTDSVSAIQGYEALANKTNNCANDGLYCSSPSSLWEGKTFNVVRNSITLSPPERYWDDQSTGVLLYYYWNGGNIYEYENQYTVQLTIDKEKFDQWYNNLPDKNAPIFCNSGSSDSGSIQPPDDTDDETSGTVQPPSGDTSSGDNSSLTLHLDELLTDQSRIIDDNTIELQFSSSSCEGPFCEDGPINRIFSFNSTWEDNDQRCNYIPKYLSIDVKQEYPIFILHGKIIEQKDNSSLIYINDSCAGKIILWLK